MAMRQNIAVAIFLIVMATGAAMAAQPGTMRLDYFHTGKANQELFSVDRVVIEPLPWSDVLSKSIDQSNLGTYYFEVRDRASSKVLYSRGFSSIYAEWETTEEAKTAHRTYHESLRFPAPEAPVRVSVQRRDAENRFREVWSTEIDTKNIYIDRSKAPAPVPVIAIQKSGLPEEKVDLLFLGEGYTAAESAKCESDIRRVTAGVFAVSPFKERQKDFNVWAICAPALESGVSRPSAGKHRHTLFDSTFDVFGTDRYALSFNNRAIRDLASYAPNEFMGIVMNESAYGNGGIFGLYASVSVDYPTGVSVYVHEFGHHFAGLGDEYYFNSNVAYAPASPHVEPWEPNITALLNPKELKWKDLVAAGTPIPTPWPKKEYEDSIVEGQKKAAQMRAENRPQAEIAAVMREARQRQNAAMDGGPYAGKVGAFEGANYVNNGFYRSQQRCMMIAGTEFCAACRRAIENMINAHVN